VGRGSSVGIATRYGAALSGDRIPVGARFFRTHPDRHWGSPSLLYSGYRVFPGGKAAGTWSWPPIPSSVENKERVELYLYSPSKPSWPVLGWPLPYFTRCVRLCLVGYLTPYWQERHNGTVSLKVLQSVHVVDSIRDWCEQRSYCIMENLVNNSLSLVLRIKPVLCARCRWYTRTDIRRR